MANFVAALLFSFLLSFNVTNISGNSAVCDNEFYPSIKQHHRLDVRHIEGSGIGYKKGYTTFEGFFAPNPSDLSLMPFLDLRGHIFNNGKFASNIGLGLRKSINNCRVLGLNTYYDYRKTKQINYNQIGFGLETLGLNYDFRLNGYFPVGKKIVKLADTDFTKFLGNYAIITENYQFDMKGFNAEIGWHIDRPSCFNFYFAAGPYHFTQDHGPKVWGGKARLACKYKDYVTLELTESYDNYFHNKFQCQLTLSLPLGREPKRSIRKYNCQEPRAVWSRMVQPVDRQEIIVQGDRKQASPALNPATGLPFFFVFVDNTSNSLGTYESPYPTLSLAQANSKPNDVIYVFPGDGTTAGMDSGITLQNNQKFWGSATSQTLPATQGNIIIPAQSDVAPTITNVALDGSAINLAASNEISGFTINNGGYGIFGADIADITISNCTINNCRNDLIHLEFSGASSNSNLTNLTLTNSQGSAIYTSSTASSDLYTVQNCTLSNNAVYAIDATFNGNAIVNLNQNTITNNVNGAIFNFNATGSLDVTNNIFSNTTSISSTPLIIISQTSPLTAMINRNTITNNTCGGLSFILNGNNLANLIIINNQIDHNGTGALGTDSGSAIFVYPYNSATNNCQLTVFNNILNANVGNALLCGSGNYNNLDAFIKNNTISDSQGSGLIFNTNTSNFTLNAANNIIENGQNHGIATIGTITIANIDISNNQITNHSNNGNGIVIAHAGNNLNLTAENNALNDNEGSGLIVYPYPAINTASINIANNSINNNQNLGSNNAGGIDIEQCVTLTGSITNNTLAGNIGAYQDFYTASTEISTTACLTLSGNSSQNGYYLQNKGTQFNLAPCNVETVNTGTINQIGAIRHVKSCPEGATCLI